MSVSIQSLEPDYVLSLEFPSKKADASNEEVTKLDSLLSLLYSKGFSAQAREGVTTGSSLLLFIKLTSSIGLNKAIEGRYPSTRTPSSNELGAIYEYLTLSEELGGVGITINVGKWSIVKSITPVSEIFVPSDFKNDVKSHLLNSEQGLRSIRNKFGIHVAFYFEFLKFFILWLVPLGVLGITSFLKHKGNFSLAYSGVNLLWGLLFISFWKRREAQLNVSWGIEIPDDVDASAQFAEKRNAKVENTKKSGIRFAKQLTFVPIALIFIAVLVTYQLSCFVIEIFLSEIYEGPGKVFLTLIPTILISVFVPILTIIYNIVADKAIQWENHEDYFSRQNSVLIKSFVLSFLTSYAPLIITSFIYLPFAHLLEPHLDDIKNTIASNVNENRFYYKYLTQLKRSEDFKINQQRLNVQYNYFIVTNQVVQLALKYVLPIVLPKVIGFVKSKINGPSVDDEREDEAEEEKWLASVREKVQLPPYDVNEDFRGITLLYGYLILFGPVWSLAPIISVVFSILTLKLDTLKLLSGKYFRPPVPDVINSIHPWNTALFLLTWLGSILSPLITVFYRHGTAPPKALGKISFDKASVNVSSPYKLFFFLFISEHGFLITYILLSKLASAFVDKEQPDDYSEELGQSKAAATKNFGPWAGFSIDSSIAQANDELSKGKRRIELFEEKKAQPKQAEVVSNADTETQVSSLNEDKIDDGSELDSRDVNPEIDNARDQGTEGNTLKDKVSSTVAAASGTAAGVIGSAAAIVTGNSKSKDPKSLLEEKRELLNEKRQELEKASGGSPVSGSKSELDSTSPSQLNPGSSSQNDPSGTNLDSTSGVNGSEDVAGASSQGNGLGEFKDKVSNGISEAKSSGKLDNVNVDDLKKQGISVAKDLKSGKSPDSNTINAAVAGGAGAIGAGGAFVAGMSGSKEKSSSGISKSGGDAKASSSDAGVSGSSAPASSSSTGKPSKDAQDETGLGKVKEQGDSIVKDGKGNYSTIDNNDHIPYDVKALDEFDSNGGEGVSANGKSDVNAASSASGSRGHTTGASEVNGPVAAGSKAGESVGTGGAGGGATAGAGAGAGAGAASSGGKGTSKVNQGNSVKTSGTKNASGAAQGTSGSSQKTPGSSGSKDSGNSDLMNKAVKKADEHTDGKASKTLNQGQEYYKKADDMTDGKITKKKSSLKRLFKK